MLLKSTITLLRVPFSFFLMPVFFLALSQVPHINYEKALLVFVILHLVMYPASNGYNSYMDRDEESIGMLEKPPGVTRQLYYVTLALDGVGHTVKLSGKRSFCAVHYCKYSRLARLQLPGHTA